MSKAAKTIMVRSVASLDDVELEVAIQAVIHGDLDVVEDRLQRGFERQRSGVQGPRGPSWRNTDWLFGRRPPGL